MSAGWQASPYIALKLRAINNIRGTNEGALRKRAECTWGVSPRFPSHSLLYYKNERVWLSRQGQLPPCTPLGWRWGWLSFSALPQCGVATVKLPGGLSSIRLRSWPSPGLVLSLPRSHIHGNYIWATSLVLQYDSLFVYLFVCFNWPFLWGEMQNKWNRERMLLWHSLYSMFLFLFFNSDFEHRSFWLPGCNTVDPLESEDQLPPLVPSLHWSLLGSLVSISVTGKERGISRRHLQCFEQNQCLATYKGRQNVQ